MWGRKRVHIASIANSSSSRATATISAASAAFIANGFSTRTGLPARSARIALSRCDRVRGRHVDHVHVGVGDERLVAGMPGLDAELIGEPVRASPGCATPRR